MTSFDQKWEAIHKDREWGRYPDNHLVRFIKRNRLNIGHGVLDIGCGVGAQSQFMGEQGLHVTAIDASEAAIVRASKYPYSLVDYEIADVTALPYKDEAFSLVTDVCCLQHIPDPHHIVAMQEITRVLKPGGMLFSVAAKWDHSQMRADTPLRTMRRDDLDRTYAPPGGLHIASTDQASFSDRNGAEWISHWIIVARKP